MVNGPHLQDVVSFHFAVLLRTIRREPQIVKVSSGKGGELLASYSHRCILYLHVVYFLPLANE